MTILAVDDDRIMRSMLVKILKEWGHDVISANDGLDAWGHLQGEPVDVVISDWMMPEMDGLELCRRIRNTFDGHYIYVILLTSKGDNEDLVRGLEAGADDFVVKPFNKQVLQARLRAGQRLLELERSLELRNRKLSEANLRLEEAHEVIQGDLEAGAQVQRSLLPDTKVRYGDYTFDWFFLPCSGVAGDLFNYARIDDDTLAFYLLDVAGHGIPSALYSVTASTLLNTYQFNQSRGTVLRESGATARVVNDLNVRLSEQEDAMLYLTIVFGTIEVKTGTVRLCIAGHPSPVQLSADGNAYELGDGGYPVGLFEGVDYEEITVTLGPGERIFVYTDGITECSNPSNQLFGAERLVRVIEETRHDPLDRALETLQTELADWRGQPTYNDDVSMLVIERDPAWNN